LNKYSEKVPKADLISYNHGFKLRKKNIYSFKLWKLILIIFFNLSWKNKSFLAGTWIKALKYSKQRLQKLYSNHFSSQNYFNGQIFLTKLSWK